ncbi:Alkyl hydroperoxide reductase subunit F [Candidatus Thermoflexus japonica]|uniref:Alkyl hydroperoxide reductase subunit F n=1 Tax=Candidatus Thermoflexus japonica TaxID=2035417 RepID=A0A2H5Y3L0_9CHLR|nr:Alkyl hydroperoxide reductase subunit F [Candidatus Thermoflexus japonica]
MALLDAHTREEVRRLLMDLKNPVRLLVFIQHIDCVYCRETRQLIEEVASLSDQITVEVYNRITDREVAERYGIDKAPAVVIEGDQDYGIRYFGIPSGYEFGSLIEDIRMVGARDSGLSPSSRKRLAQIQTPVHIQVFVTPTCPYCPRMVRLAHQAAMESPWIRADMVEAMEFPELADYYGVYGVPRTVINEVIHIEGAVPEGYFINELMKVTDPEAMARARAAWEHTRHALAGAHAHHHHHGDEEE